MLSYLSDEWISALDTAVSAHAPLRAATEDVALVVQQVVTDVPRSTGPDTVAYSLRFDRGSNHVAAGTDPDADVSFTCRYPTAVAIATGSESAQTAFMAGRLRIGGDTRALMAHQSALANLDDVLAAVRVETDFGDRTRVAP